MVDVGFQKKIVIKFNSQVMLLELLNSSINIPVVNLSIDIGLYKLIKNWINVSVSKKILTPFPSISLGSVNLRSIEIA